jgi:hypothetical protein
MAGSPDRPALHFVSLSVSTKIDGALFALFDGFPLPLPDCCRGSRKRKWGRRSDAPAIVTVFRPVARKPAIVLAAVKDKPFGWPPRWRPSLTAARHDGATELRSGRKNGFAEVEQKNAHQAKCMPIFC